MKKKLLFLPLLLTVWAITSCNLTSYVSKSKEDAITYAARNFSEGTKVDTQTIYQAKFDVEFTQDGREAIQKAGYSKITDFFKKVTTIFFNVDETFTAIEQIFKKASEDGNKFKTSDCMIYWNTGATYTSISKTLDIVMNTYFGGDYTHNLVYCATNKPSLYISGKDDGFHVNLGNNKEAIFKTTVMRYDSNGYLTEINLDTSDSNIATLVDNGTKTNLFTGSIKIIKLIKY